MSTVLLFPQMVVCPICNATLNLVGRPATGIYTYQHQAGPFECPNTGHTFTFPLPSVAAEKS